MNILISACLLGTSCRYDAKSKPNQKILDLIKNPNVNLIPFCPEIYGGLPTPRTPCEITVIEPVEMTNNTTLKVVSADGIDRTFEYEKGANEALRLCKLFDIKTAILKEKSPSCGSGLIYDGTFSRKLVEGDGVTAKLLKENGIRVFGESDFSLSKL